MNHRCFMDYIKDVENQLRNSHNYDENRITEITNNLKNFNTVQYHFPRKGWKYLIEHFAPEIKRNENVYFVKINETRSAMCLKTDTDKYIVTFAFKHPKDEYNPDYKKYLVYKYILARDITDNFQNETLINSGILHNKKYYVFNNIKASSYKNAIVLANNKYLKNNKLTLFLCLEFNQDIDYPSIREEVFDSKEYYFNNCYENYKRIREQLKDEYNLEDKDIRFYYNSRMGIMVLRFPGNKYQVTFSFINPKDRYHLDRIKNFGDVKHIYRYCLIKNFLTNVHTYTLDNADNSMDATTKAFNTHRYDFPSYYHDNKLDIVIKSENDIIC